METVWRHLTLLYRHKVVRHSVKEPSACLQDSPNRRGVLGSKACGEPSLLLAVSVLHALRMAASVARSDPARCKAEPAPVVAAGEVPPTPCRCLCLSRVQSLARQPRSTARLLRCASQQVQLLHSASASYWFSLSPLCSLIVLTAALAV